MKWKVTITSVLDDSTWGLSELPDQRERVELLCEDIPTVLDGAMWQVEEMPEGQ